MWGGAKRRTLRDFYDSKIGKSTMESADLITCVSKHERDMLISEIGIDHNNIKIIYNGIHWDDWQEVPDPNIFRDKYPEITDKFVLFAGRLATNKGLSDLIKAMSLLDSNNFDLVLMGADMGLSNDLKKEAKSMNVRAHIIGHVDDILYRSALSAAEVMVLPSEYEAFGIVLLEAAAAETPVIGTRVGGIPEAMSDGENGFLVDYKNPNMLAERLSELLADENLCKRMGENGREFSSDFSWSSIVNQIESEYFSLL